MEIGIVGLPNVGKSAVFKTMTGMNVEVANYPFTTTKAIHGTAPVPDPRLALIGRFIKTRKFVSATIDLVDIPAIVAGSAKGEGMGNSFLDSVRQVDALAHVVRCFDDPDVLNVFDSVDPVRDVQAVEMELLLADLQVLEGAMEKANRRAKIGDASGKKRIEIASRAVAVLEQERPLRAQEWSREELVELRSLGMITLRPVLYVANVGEEDLKGESDAVAALKKWVEASEGGQTRMVPICAKLEAEIAELDQAERQEMLEGLGLNEPALAVLARALYDLLGLQSFYTAGEPEIRAWTIRKAETAPEAAGAIHSDIQRGFIRAETYSVEDLVKFHTEQAIRAAGKMRSEGKSYVLQDGDVCHFLFNV